MSVTWDELDELVDTDTIELRDRAWGEITKLRDLLDHSRAYVAELLQTQREPRVWLPGDTVPAGVWVHVGAGDVMSPGDEPWVTRYAAVELTTEGYVAVVAAEKARRVATDGEVAK